MSKWRPRQRSCLYVIPDIHGQDDLLEKILRRILPLRKSDGVQDKIVFLGDYIDRGEGGHKVLDRLIELKEKYGNRVICLCGNHEIMLLESLGYIDCPSPTSIFNMWKQNGALNTMVGYMERAGIYESPIDFGPGRVKDLIPKEHIDFMLHQLDGCYEEDGFVFVHGGCNPHDSPTKYDVRGLAWDRMLYKTVIALIKAGEPLPWKEPVIITGHSTDGPVVKDQYMMLDCGPGKLLVVEAYTREAFMSKPFKSRLVRVELKETVFRRSKMKPVFRRSATQ